jgi:GDP-L-fucose synthase
MAGERKLEFIRENDWLDKPFSLKGKRVWVAGHRGMVGSALVRRLRRENCTVVTIGREHLDLRRQSDVDRWVLRNRPDVIILAAAKVGGIAANAREPADFLYDNIMIEANVIRAAYRANIEKLLFLGSSCIYPKYATQPISEDALLSAPLEPTNEAYAIAKIAGVKLCEAYRRQYGRDFISAMPCNLYGPGDNYDLKNSHVIPALLRRAHEAVMRGESELKVWGSGTPRREFMHVDDLADALVFILKNYSAERPVNVGMSKDVSISELAQIICAVTGFKSKIAYQTSAPDGTPRKLMDSSNLYGAGWRPSIPLKEGLERTYAAYLADTGLKKAA